MRHLILAAALAAAPALAAGGEQAAKAGAKTEKTEGKRGDTRTDAAKAGQGPHGSSDTTGGDAGNMKGYGYGTPAGTESNASAGQASEKKQGSRSKARTPQLEEDADSPQPNPRAAEQGQNAGPMDRGEGADTSTGPRRQGAGSKAGTSSATESATGGRSTSDTPPTDQQPRR
jgi:hypothetical protein